VNDLDVARLVDIRTAGKLLGGIGRSHVYELLGIGELESVKIGRRRMVLVDSIDAYIERLRAVEATS
jgi:excisionase family DNA binding protein